MADNLLGPTHLRALCPPLPSPDKCDIEVDRRASGGTGSYISDS